MSLGTLIEDSSSAILADADNGLMTVAAEGHLSHPTPIERPLVVAA